MEKDVDDKKPVCNTISMKTMNKQECLDHLDEVENAIKSHEWEGLCETENLLTATEMRDYLPTFNLPESEGIFGTTVYLPIGWLEGETSDSLDYQEVANRYYDVYDLLRDLASQEMEAMSNDEASLDAQMHRDYWSSVV